MGELIISNLIGLFFGLFTSFFSWWVLFHVIVPKVKFSRYISKIPGTDEESGWRYQFKFINDGKRSLIDVQVVARYSVKGLTILPSKTWNVVSIPLDWEHETEFKIPEISVGRSRAVRLFINEAKPFKKSMVYPENIHAKAKDTKLCLEDILCLGNEAKITMYVSGYDEFSGARKMFKSKSYTIDDIKEGRFHGLDISPSEIEPSVNSKIEMQNEKIEENGEIFID